MSSPLIISLISLTISVIVLLFNAPKMVSNFIDGIFSIKYKWLMYNKVINAHDLSDDEYFYLQKIEQRYGFEQNHTPDSDYSAKFCKRLANHGALITNKDGSYKVTRAGKRVSHEPRNE